MVILCLLIGVLGLLVAPHMVQEVADEIQAVNLILLGAVRLPIDPECLSKRGERFFVPSRRVQGIGNIDQTDGLVRGVAHLAKEGERILIGGQGLLVAFHRVQGVADIKKALCLLLLIVRQAAVEF